MIVDNDLMPLVAKLADCLCAELEASDLAVDCCVVEWGTEVDLTELDGGSGSRAWVAITDVFQTADFPTPDSGETPCDKDLAVSVSVGVARCVSINAKDQDLFMIAARGMADMKAMRRAILCCEDLLVALGQFETFHEGGIAGGQWSVVLGKP